MSDRITTNYGRSAQGYDALSRQAQSMGGHVTYYESTVIEHDDGTSNGIVYSVTETDGKTNAERMKESQDELLEKAQERADETASVVYEKSDDEDRSQATAYTAQKTSPEERARVLSQLKQADEDRQKQLTDLVRRMLEQQGTAYNKANKWKALASGHLRADADTVRQAQADISEDGYWGVKQTSQRLFDFAQAYAGDDVEKMRTMQQAMEKGFKLAGGQWGKKLPDICYQTMDAARAKFDEWFKENDAAI